MRVHVSGIALAVGGAASIIQVCRREGSGGGVFILSGVRAEGGRRAGRRMVSACTAKACSVFLLTTPPQDYKI